MLYRVQWLKIVFYSFIAYALFFNSAVMASAIASGIETISLNNIVLKTNEQNKVQVVLQFSGSILTPQNFSVEDPPTIAFDFLNVKNKISRDVLQKITGIGVLENVDVLETKDKTRVVLNLKKMVSSDLDLHKNELRINLDAPVSSGLANPKKNLKGVGAYQIKSFDFRRGDHGDGRLIVQLSSAKAAVDMDEDTNQTILSFMGASIEDNLLKKYDVMDFATPIDSVEITREDGMVRFRVSTKGDYNRIVYQVDNQFILEARPKIKGEEKTPEDLGGGYNGNKISLDFQDIQLRAILQVIADFSKFNMITSDNVKGSITLRLQNLPWDQALDIILKSKGLDKRQMGNVMMIGTAEELASREKTELETQKQAQELGVLKSELIQINYAQASDIATILKDKTNSLLTSRGNVTVDTRTNTLLVQDIEPKLIEVKSLLKKLDIPVRQVEIATQIIEVDTTIASTLGVRFGGGANAGVGRRQLGIGSKAEKARAIADNGSMYPSAAKTALTSGAASTASAPSGLSDGTVPQLQNTEGLFSDLGATAIGGAGATASVGLALARLPNGTLLDLELQALEYETCTKSIARPKLVTMDQVKASISKGQQIPYQQSSSSGAATISFQNAVLKLDVTPHITADDRISLDLDISNDGVGKALADGSIPINTTSIQTKVLADNGETLVLGGVLSVTDGKAQSRVPFFGSLPIIGGLFRNKSASYHPDELLIFITPRIINIIKDRG